MTWRSSLAGIRHMFRRAGHHSVKDDLTCGICERAFVGVAA